MSLQSPFSDLEFEMIGDGTTPVFFQASPTNGAISVRPNVDLAADTASQYVVSILLLSVYLF